MKAGTELARLRRVLGSYRSLLVAYSGGVDSSVVALAARQVLGAPGVLAVLGRSMAVSEEQLALARAIAERFFIPYLELDTREVERADYQANNGDRCFVCKSELWDVLAPMAEERGFEALADGSNLDDLGDVRPGRRAGALHRVRSPLVDAGLGKAGVRAVARELGLPNWDAPASPCLSSRLVHGVRVTPERLAGVAALERVVRGRLGVPGDLRARAHSGGVVRIEAGLPWFDRFAGRAVRDELRRALEDHGFHRVALDLRGFRTGSGNGLRATGIEMVDGVDPSLRVFGVSGIVRVDGIDFLEADLARLESLAAFQALHPSRWMAVWL